MVQYSPKAKEARNFPLTRICKSGLLKFQTNQSRKIWHFSQHICVVLKVKTAYVSITSCLGSIVRCFQFFRVSSSSGKGASYEPPHSPRKCLPLNPLPLGISCDLPWGGGYGYFLEPHNSCIQCTYETAIRV